MPLWLSERDVRASISMPELVDAMEAALAALSRGSVTQPVRSVLEIADRSFFALMPAFDTAAGILGAKLVSVVPANADRGLHTHLAAISLFDGTTGELAAVMDGRYITEVRTAAASAVSCRYLASKDARVLAILGSGVQARSHLQALPLVRNFAEIRAWSPNRQNLERFVTESSGRISPASTASDATHGADVIVIATSSVTPAICNAWVSDGAHVIAVGACRPTQQEVDPDLVGRAYLVVDSRAAALKESGDILIPIRDGRFGPEHVRAELGEIVAGCKPGRTDRAQVTLFKSLGQAIEDLVAASLAFRRAQETGRGAHVEI